MKLNIQEILLKQAESSILKEIDELISQDAESRAKEANRRGGIPMPEFLRQVCSQEVRKLENQLFEIQLELKQIMSEIEKEAK